MESQKAKKTEQATEQAKVNRDNWAKGKTMESQKGFKPQKSTETTEQAKKLWNHRK